MPNQSENALPKIGYLYHYPKLDHLTEKFRLDIFLSSIPTEQHFDVLRFKLFVESSQGGIERLTITHPWHFEQTIRVCPGMIIMEDRKGKLEEAFTFGGQLQIDVLELLTKCILVSSAPIFKISGATPTHKLFIDELEILLAERRGSSSDRDEYEKILINTDAFELYLACLKELILKFEEFPQKNDEYIELLMFLHSQEHRLEEADLVIDPTPSLDDIFGK